MLAIVAIDEAENEHCNMHVVRSTDDDYGMTTIRRVIHAKAICPPDYCPAQRSAAAAHSLRSDKSLTGDLYEYGSPSEQHGPFLHVANVNGCNTVISNQRNKPIQCCQQRTRLFFLLSFLNLCQHSQATHEFVVCVVLSFSLSLF